MEMQSPSPHTNRYEEKGPHHARRITMKPGGSLATNGQVDFKVDFNLSFTHRIHGTGTYIYLHLVDFNGKCRLIYQSHGSYG